MHLPMQRKVLIGQGHAWKPKGVRLRCRSTPADARYLENHRGHLMFLRPAEHQVCTAELIRAVTITGTRSALRERLRKLQDAGYTHFSIHIRHGHPAMLEEWAEVIAGD